jgi:Subtilase family
LAELLARDPTALEVRADPAALAPERLLVFEVRGSIQNFAAAVRRVDGLELIDEEELLGDELDKSPVAYLLVPDARAFRQILSLWTRWQEGRSPERGFTSWRDVFALLRDLRPWGPTDRVRNDERDILTVEIEGRPDDDRVKLEIELVFRADAAQAAVAEDSVRPAIVAVGGRILDQARIEDIAYHALLADLPVRTVRAIIGRAQDGLAGLGPIMHIRPQSAAPSIELADSEPAAQLREPPPDRPPILALFDGVPIAAHPLLNGRLNVEDRFGLEGETLVANREHGTAMASIIVHGDRNRSEAALPRRIHVVPVLKWGGTHEVLPDNRLIVDLIYQAVIGMREGTAASAPDVLIINLSLGNARRPFVGQMSAWARLLDRLAWRYGLLFVVSAGNAPEAFEIPAFSRGIEFEDADANTRAHATLSAIGDLIAERRIIAPAETVNGITIGGSNEDAVSDADRRFARANVDPYPELRMSNPSSRLGPGFANSVKPDILMPAAREHLRTLSSGSRLKVVPAAPSRAFGLKAAAPPTGGNLGTEGFTNGTSAAAALASRTCHRIHDALEEAYGDGFIGLGHIGRAAVIKALLAHGARWPEDVAQLIRDIIGPADRRQSVRQKDNIRRFLGYGTLDPDDAVACATDRATFWAAGLLPAEQAALVDVPVPICISGKTLPHALFATVAWFTPVRPGRQSYRSVRLSLLEPTELSSLGVSATSGQPDANQIKRGTVLSRRWVGDRAPAIIESMTAKLIVQREPDQGGTIDDAVPFGVAVTLSMPGAVELYDQVRLRLGLPERIRGT